MTEPIYRRPSKKQRQKPRVLTAQHARIVLGAHVPCFTVGTVTMRATFVREEMTRQGTPSWIWRNPFTGTEHRFVVDFKTGVQRDLGPIRRTLPQAQRVAQLPAPRRTAPDPLVRLLLPWLRS